MLYGLEMIGPKRGQFSPIIIFLIYVPFALTCLCLRFSCISINTIILIFRRLATGQIPNFFLDFLLMYRVCHFALLIGFYDFYIYWKKMGVLQYRTAFWRQIIWRKQNFNIIISFSFQVIKTETMAFFVCHSKYRKICSWLEF